MKKVFNLILGLCISQLVHAQIVINELDCDTPGIDTEEFIELKSATPNFPLDGYVLVLFNGSTSGADSSYFSLDLDGSVTDDNGLLLIGSTTVTPFPQLIVPGNLIQNGADAVAIYFGNDSDFPDGTLATTVNLIDALNYDTADADDTVLMGLLGETTQYNEGSGNNTNSIQLNNDGVTYTITTPTPRQLNDGSGIVYNAISISTLQTQYNEGDSFDITFTAQSNVTTDVNFSFSLDNGGFNSSDFTGNTSLTILNGQNSVSTTITIVDDALDEGDEEPLIQFSTLNSPYIPFNNFIKLRCVDNDFQVAPYGVPTNPTYGIVASTQPTGYYDSADGLANVTLRQALQDIVADQATVRAQTYDEIIDILKEADVNPENSNQVWLVYTEQGRAKLDFQTTSSSVGKWNREHTFPRSLGGYNDIEADDINDGINVYWTTNADSTRHANSDGHGLRAADGPENSTRNNQHYGQYNGPVGTLGSFKGDVARSVLFLALRYNGLEVVNGFPAITGQMGDLATLLDWHRNDPPDDYEMNRNNEVYTWQFNRNPFIDHPLLVEHIWGTEIANNWTQVLSTPEFESTNLSIYPNPVTDQLYINGKHQEYQVTLFSVNGQKIWAKTVLNQAALDVQLPAGMYFAQIRAGNSSFTKKIIVQ